MRDLLAIILVVFVLAGILAAWRYSVVERRRNSHSARFRLVGPSADEQIRR